MTKKELLDQLRNVPENYDIIFSISPDIEKYPFLRFFISGIAEIVNDDIADEAIVVVDGVCNNDFQNE